MGGGISKKSDKFLPLLTGLTAPVIPARMLNDAGIVGAAMAADQAPGGNTGPGLSPGSPATGR